MKATDDIPRVFISYAWSGKEHRQWIEHLARKLMADGIDVVIDFWELKEGQDKNAFMERSVTDESIQRVLLICDEVYKEKADARVGGVGTESQIISEKVYQSAQQTKFIPIISKTDSSGSPPIPTYLSSRIYIDLSVEETYLDEYRRLIRNIFERPLSQKPPLGTKPQYLEPGFLLSVKSLNEFETFNRAVRLNSESANPELKLLLQAITGGLTSIQADIKSTKNADATILDSISDTLPYKSQFCSAIDTWLLYERSEPLPELVHSFFENLLSSCEPSPSENTQPTNLDYLRFVTLEMFLNLMALSIKHKNPYIFNFMIEEVYIFQRNFGLRQGSYTAIRQNIQSLDLRNKRLNLRRVSLTADTLKERSTTAVTKFNQVVEADFILFLRSVLDAASGVQQPRVWFPTTAVYVPDYGAFETFQRAISKRRFKSLAPFLNVSTGDELRSRYTQARDQVAFENWDFGNWDFEPSRLMNLEELDKY